MVMPYGRRLQARHGAIWPAPRREPASAAWVLGFHLVGWTRPADPRLSHLQLDLAEDSRSARSGSAATGSIRPSLVGGRPRFIRSSPCGRGLLLGPLAVVVCFYAVWLLAARLPAELEALVAVLALEAIHFYNFSAVKFAHDQLHAVSGPHSRLFF